MEFSTNKIAKSNPQAGPAGASSGWTKHESKKMH